MEVMMALGMFAGALGGVIFCLGVVQGESRANSTAVAINEIIDAPRALYPDTWVDVSPWDIAHSDNIPRAYVNDTAKGQAGAGDSDAAKGRFAFIFPNGSTGTIVNNGGGTAALYLWNVRQADCVSLLGKTANLQYYSFIQVSWYQLGCGSHGILSLMQVGYKEAAQRRPSLQ